MTRNKPPPSAERVSAIVAALEDAYAAFRQPWPELPDVAVTVFCDRRRSVRGYFWDDQWKHGAGALPELHIDSTILKEPAEGILRTLIQEAVHARAKALGMQETSRDGRYHNHRFAGLAREMGLAVERDRRIGYRTPTVRPELLDGGPYTILLMKIERASSVLWQGAGVDQPGGGDSGAQTVKERDKPKGRMLKATCDCDPPRIIRAARGTLEVASVTCGACGHPFTGAETTRRQ